MEIVDNQQLNSKIGGNPCAHTSQPMEYKLTCHIGQKKSHKVFSFNCKIEKGIYVCTLSGFEEWGLLFN